jgi:hypothetical protein
MAPPSPDPDRWPDLRAMMGLALSEIKNGAAPLVGSCGPLIRIGRSTLDHQHVFRGFVCGSISVCVGSSAIAPDSMSHANIGSDSAPARTLLESRDE